MQKLEGTAITELVEGGRLRRADILLTHTKRSLWGWLIRCATRCYWNHAFIIYMLRDLNEEFDKTLIIDPKMGCILLDNIAPYFERPHKHDIAVKRLEMEWFQSDGKVGGLPYRQKVCDIALRETDDKYDPLTRRLVRRILRYVTLVYRFLFRRGRHSKLGQGRVSLIDRRLKINAYSCGAFVQWCYYQGVSQILHDSQDKSRLQEVIFNPRWVGQISDDDLLSTTPADLARSDKLSWKYVVKDGVVWEVSTEEEVSSLL